MFPIPLKEGLFVELESDTDHGHAHYLSKILSLSPSQLQVSYSRALSEQQVQIDQATEFRAGVITESGNYGFRTSVLKVEQSPELSLFISPPIDVYEWQRRYLRLDAAIWVRYRMIPSLADVGIDPPARRSFATTANIGGGGLLLRVDEQIPVSTLLELEIDIPTLEEPVLALGKVVHAYGGRGIEFLLINEPDRDAIIRHVFSVVRSARAVQSRLVL